MSFSLCFLGLLFYLRASINLNIYKGEMMENNSPSNENGNSTYVTPVPATTETPMQPPLTPTPPMQNNSSKRSLKKLIPAVLAVIVLVAVALYGLLVFLPAQQLKNFANNFVSTATEGDYEKSFEMTDSEEDQKDSVIGLIESLDTQLDSSDYKIRKIEKDNEKSQVTYELVDDKDKWFRIEIEKIDGKFKVVGIFLGIGDVDEDVEAEEESTNSSGDTAVKTPTTCLPAASLQKFWRYTSGWQFYFKADSNDLEFSDSSAVQSIDEMKTFYDDNKQYQFAFVIDVSLYQATGSDADVELAKDRAGIVAYNLNLAGVPYEFMRLGKATSGGNANNPEYATGSRYANVTINSSCDSLSETPDFTEENVGR